MKRDPALPPGEAPRPSMVWIPGGTFRMGSEDFYPEERPVHEVTVDGFRMDQYAVTNQEFARFVEATGYVTVGERAPAQGRRLLISWISARSARSLRRPVLRLARSRLPSPI